MKKKLYILLAILIVVVYGAWYAYCHYYPMLLRRSASPASPDIVNTEYRFSDVNSTHLSAAKRNGIKPVSNRDNLQTESLTKIKSCNQYKVEHLTHSVPYLTPEAAKLLNEIGARFQQALKEEGLERHRIIVTSVLRTEEDVRQLQKVNGNASSKSAHQYATTFDITYVRFDRQSLWGKSATNKQLANILGEVLSQLHKERRCYIKYERKQCCFHITSKERR